MIAWLLASLALAAPLSLDTVLAGVDDRVPELAAAEAKLVQAEAKLLSARGAFDPVLAGKLGAYGGKDPRQLADVGVSVPTALGPSLQASYGLGRGDFPAYDGDRETGPGGEWRLKATLPLLDGLGLSDERARLWVARAGTALADAELAGKRVDVRQKAASSYWKWVAAGAKVRVEEALLAQAEARNLALSREVEEGLRPRIDLLDNERVLLQRRDDLARAQRDLQVAALSLSLWHRDGTGAPLVPAAADLPELTAPPPQLPDAEVDRGRVTERPDVVAVDALLEAGRVERSRAGNALLPDLSLVGEVIRPTAADADPELYAGAELKLPTLLRKDRGERDRSVAALTGLEAVRRGTLDAGRAEVDAARVAIETAWQRVQWTRDASERAAEVVTLEGRRFELGGGDMFQLLTRESNLAKARKAEVEALLDYHLAVAARSAAIAEVP